jgi:hypothetical protein
MTSKNNLIKKRFIDNDNGTIADSFTGLIWQEGFAYRETGNYISWYDANDYVEELNKKKLGEFSDWRLPNKLEIQTLYEIAHPFESRGKTFTLHIDPIFEFSYGSCFWTSRTRLSAALGFEFDAGDTHWYPQSSSSGTVRAVRLNSDLMILIKKKWTDQLTNDTFIK